MANVRTSVEGARGCGFRKGGGIYLIAGGIPRPCGKLPIPLTSCPTCSTGIKPARGWTWVDADALLANVHCDSDQGDRCSVCPMSKPMGRAGLLWIGEKFYPRPADWSREALSLGVSRRISQVPHDLVIGQTWVLVAHRKTIETVCDHCRGAKVVPTEVDSVDTITCPDCEGDGVAFTPAIFQAFQPTALEYVITGKENEDELDKLEKRGFSLVKVIEAHSEQDQDKEDADEIK